MAEQKAPMTSRPPVPACTTSTPQPHNPTTSVSGVIIHVMHPWAGITGAYFNAPVENVWGSAPPTGTEAQVQNATPRDTAATTVSGSSGWFNFFALQPPLGAPSSKSPSSIQLPPPCVSSPKPVRDVRPVEPRTPPMRAPPDVRAPSPLNLRRYSTPPSPSQPLPKPLPKPLASTTQLTSDPGKALVKCNDVEVRSNALQNMQTVTSGQLGQSEYVRVNASNGVTVAVDRIHPDEIASPKALPSRSQHSTSNEVVSSSGSEADADRIEPINPAAKACERRTRHDANSTLESGEIREDGCGENGMMNDSRVVTNDVAGSGSGDVVQQCNMRTTSETLNGTGERHSQHHSPHSTDNTRVHPGKPAEEETPPLHVIHPHAAPIRPFSKIQQTIAENGEFTSNNGATHAHLPTSARNDMLTPQRETRPLPKGKARDLQPSNSANPTQRQHGERNVGTSSQFDTRPAKIASLSNGPIKKRLGKSAGPRDCELTNNVTNSEDVAVRAALPGKDGPKVDRVEAKHSDRVDSRRLTQTTFGPTSAKRKHRFTSAPEPKRRAGSAPQEAAQPRRQQSTRADRQRVRSPPRSGSQPVPSVPANSEHAPKLPPKKVLVPRSQPVPPLRSAPVPESQARDAGVGNTVQNLPSVPRKRNSMPNSGKENRTPGIEEHMKALGFGATGPRNLQKKGKSPPMPKRSARNVDELLALGPPLSNPKPPPLRMDLVRSDALDHGPASSNTRLPPMKRAVPGPSRAIRKDHSPKRHLPGHAPPAKKCHVCDKEGDTLRNPVRVCGNHALENMNCRKVVCRKCRMQYDDASKLKPGQPWTCFHCRGKCPRSSTCYSYTNANLRRRLEGRRGRGKLYS